MTCESCKGETLSLTIFKTSLICRACLAIERGNIVQAHSVITDEIPGGVLIQHGVCHEDGTPRKFYSKSAIREAAFQQGYFQGNDTPKVNQRLIEQREMAREKAR